MTSPPKVDSSSSSNDKAPDLRTLCHTYGIRFKKGLGQNLLLDDNINRIMVDAASLSEADDVIEVGAGLGALTHRLCRHAGRLLSVEIDASFMPCLEDQFGDRSNVRLFRGDILNHPVKKITEEFLPGGQSYKLVSNLPYYITTPILFHFLESEVFFNRLVVMMQIEVGQRLVAPVGASNYGTLALAAQCYAEVDLVHRVPATCFLPRPKVDSSIVRFRCRPVGEEEKADQALFMQIVRAGFEQRRKTLRNTLARSGRLGMPEDMVLDAMDVAKIDPTRRAQSLHFDEFSLLAQEIKLRRAQIGESETETNAELSP
jgi:16S rRNA (adenine1518-N6/adenine1519-N6)-dimethyltransferase